MRGAESNLESAWSRSPGTQVCPATSLLGGFICHRGWNGSELPIDTKDVQCDRAQVSSEVGGGCWMLGSFGCSVCYQQGFLSRGRAGKKVLNSLLHPK